MKILNFGSLNIDYIYRVDHFVRSGETVSSRDLQVFPGGKGLNSSIALKRAGAEVCHAGAVGKADGQPLIDILNQNGVDTAYIKSLDCASGHAIIQVAQDGQNCILLYGGANQRIKEEHADSVMQSFGEGDYLLLQNEICLSGYIMEIAHKKKMTVVLNPSPMDSRIFDMNFSYVDYLVLNEIEAYEICKEKLTDEETLEKLSAAFPNAKIILTLGARGSYYKDSETVLKHEAYKTSVVDTTAAGDTFLAYFISGVSKGKTVEESLDTASKAAAIAITKAGAEPSIPRIEDVDSIYTEER